MLRSLEKLKKRRRIIFSIKDIENKSYKKALPKSLGLTIPPVVKIKEELRTILFSITVLSMTGFYQEIQKITLD